MVHYDVNDFDETTSGRFTFDVARLATSLFLAAREAGLLTRRRCRCWWRSCTPTRREVQRLVQEGGRRLDVSEAPPSGSRVVDEFMTRRRRR